MPGKVFISCGQRSPEKETAEKIGKLIKSLGLNYYLACKIQGLDDIMRITDELKSSDYYLFVDFLRTGSNDLPCSLFTHQELSLAHHLGFKEIIAFQQKGAPLEGFLRYVQSNPDTFETEKELLEKIKNTVIGRKWNKNYSRNLIVGEIDRVGPIQFTDHTGTNIEYIWRAKIQNLRPDIAAHNAVCILDCIIMSSGEKTNSYDRNYLKWAGQKEPQRTILPLDYAIVDIFAVHMNKNGVYLHSTRDNIPRHPIFQKEGIYKLGCKVYSEHFPLLSFGVKIEYKHNPKSPQPINYRTQAIVIQQWTNDTKAELIK